MSRSKIIIGVVAALSLLGIGTGVVLAASGDDDKPLHGSAREQATEAALDYVGGGTVIETEIGDDGAAYGVEIQTEAGKVVEVNLDENFHVIGAESADHGPNTEHERNGD